MRNHLVAGAFGLALGFVLSGSGFTDWGEIHRMFTFGIGAGGPTAGDLRPLVGYAVAIVVALIGFRLLAWRDELPPKPVRAGTVPGAVLFGIGLAIAGVCPGAVLAQIGEGKAAALVSFAGMLAGAWLHDALRKRFGWARYSCID